MMDILDSLSNIYVDTETILRFILGIFIINALAGFYYSNNFVIGRTWAKLVFGEVDLDTVDPRFPYFITLFCQVLLALFIYWQVSNRLSYSATELFQSALQLWLVAVLLELPHTAFASRSWISFLIDRLWDLLVLLVLYFVMGLRPESIRYFAMYLYEPLIGIRNLCSMSTFMVSDTIFRATVLDAVQMDSDTITRFGISIILSWVLGFVYFHPTAPTGYYWMKSIYGDADPLTMNDPLLPFVSVLVCHILLAVFINFYVTDRLHSMKWLLSMAVHLWCMTALLRIPHALFASHPLIALAVELMWDLITIVQTTFVLGYRRMHRIS